jgi:hypothetical protein
MGNILPESLVSKQTLNPDKKDNILHRYVFTHVLSFNDQNIFGLHSVGKVLLSLG